MPLLENLMAGQLCPDYEGLELGIGESLLMKAIAESTGRSLAQIKADYRDSGDLGTVAKVTEFPDHGFWHDYWSPWGSDN